MKRTCLFLILLLLAACRTTQTLQTDTTREVRIVERDTLITIAPDSATVRAIVEGKAVFIHFYAFVPDGELCLVYVGSMQHHILLGVLYTATNHL